MLAAFLQQAELELLGAAGAGDEQRGRQLTSPASPGEEQHHKTSLPASFGLQSWSKTALFEVLTCPHTDQPLDTHLTTQVASVLR